MPKYSTQILKEVRNEIAFFPVEKQAKYADHICIANCNNRAFLKMQFDAIGDTIRVSDFANYNSTTIGNLAYLSLNCNVENYAIKCRNILGAFRKYCEANK